MQIIECEQNSPEWFAARLGRVTASGMDRIITPTGMESKSADKYMNELIGEIITGESADGWKGNAHSDRGKEWEPQAAEFYQTLRDVELQRVGFIVSDDGFVGCSPDYLIGADGMLEIKTGLPHILIEYYLSGKLEQDHRPQTQTGLWVGERQWIDTMLYHPLMKPIIIRSQRNEPYLNSMAGMVARFRQNMLRRIAELQAKGFMS
jgi:hypothetical protein